MGTLRFPWPCLARRGGTRSLENEQARATLDGQNTCYGVRSGPKYSPWCTGEAPECPATGSARKRPAAGGEKLANVQRKKKRLQKLGHSLVYYTHHTMCTAIAMTTSLRTLLDNKYGEKAVSCLSSRESCRPAAARAITGHEPKTGHDIYRSTC